MLLVQNHTWIKPNVSDQWGTWSSGGRSMALWCEFPALTSSAQWTQKNRGLKPQQLHPSTHAAGAALQEEARSRILMPWALVFTLSANQLWSGHFFSLCLYCSICKVATYCLVCFRGSFSEPRKQTWKWLIPVKYTVNITHCIFFVIK